ncbi:hypothetical protein [Lysobacter solisilvae (ex Woo and Kim 2020)]|uniref:Uncharacterized protein n=1 Tax=Agrilutibacter terrestris TaxID=2865112 RepID=A0A7H0FZA4_9GAMM|nr:hypothetical protein [Lysobacter terrestris]QNP41370.1 hypothetical protein H8B22_03875 [Lysobacter terrestris]
MNALRAGLVAFALTLSVAMPAQAGGARKAAVPTMSVEHKLAGHYYLEGVMETGSELQLDANGRFQWYFSYGALDLAAEGQWQHEGGKVVLLPEHFQFPPQYPQTEFKRMQLRVDGADLVPAWPWEEGAERGRYVLNEDR